MEEESDGESFCFKTESIPGSVPASPLGDGGGSGRDTPGLGARTEGLAAPSPYPHGTPGSLGGRARCAVAEPCLQEHLQKLQISAIILGFTNHLEQIMSLRTFSVSFGR